MGQRQATTRPKPAPSGIGWVVALVGVLHLPSLFNPFVADDYVYLGTANELTWSAIPTLLVSPTMDTDASAVWWTPEGVLPFYRPLAILSFAADFRVWGLNPFGFHLTNLGLHLLCVWMVCRLALRVTKDRTAALAAAVVFGVHPVHSEAVLWISGRFDVLVCSLMLAAALAFLRYQDGGRRAIWLVLVIACFIAGLGCKETALILPAVLLAMSAVCSNGGGLLGESPGNADVVLTDRGNGWGVVPAVKNCLKSYAGVWAGLIAVAGGYIALRFSIFGGMGELPPPYGVDLTSPAAVLIVLRTIAQYVLDWVFFIHVEAFYLDGFWAEHGVLLLACSAAAGLVIYWGWRRAGRTRGFAVGTAWALLFMAPSLKAMPGERNIYLASAGFALVCGSVFSQVWKRALSDERRRRGVTRSAGALAAICVVLAAVDHVIMWGVADVSQTVYDDLLARLPDPPRGARIYVVNQCPLNAGGFIQGGRLYYGRDDVVACALTLAPRFQGRSTDVVYRTGPSTVRIVRENGRFFESFLEKFALFSRPVSTMRSSARRLGLELRSPPATLDDVQSLELTLPGALDDGRTFVFTWDNTRLRTLRDLIRRSRWPRLVPAEILDPPVSVAQTPAGRRRYDTAPAQ